MSHPFSTNLLLPHRNPSPNPNLLFRAPITTRLTKRAPFSSISRGAFENLARLATSPSPRGVERSSASIKAAKISGDFMGSTKWNETAMLVIDMQNDFILPDCSVHVADGLAIVPSVIQAVSVARERGIFVIWVVREHDRWGRDVELFRRHFYADGKGPATKTSKGAELVDGLSIEGGDYKLVKMRFSAFLGTHLHSLLQNSGIKNLVVVGVQTPNCIRQTVFDAVSLDYQHVSVISDATAAATPEIHFANMRDMKNIGVATPTLQEWCSSDP
ncbi:probable inactive nicotinamidase At3g16190 isoform X2 [Ananas comosus]|uniref:Probable inactive nicotinamidase At3g16190 isoform X2 n=1 Tax=Ananas comosus TaxID=4615 RepID=A0A6P5FWV0_ANACO|nr:probable inactive nicotinamidase At3g16190 isoform X2 [Ananas comosus]